MQEDKSHLLYFAMRYGIFLGLFWILKYLFIIGAKEIPILMNVNSLLSIGTIILLVYFLIKYKSKINTPIGYWHCVSFSILLFFFAAIFEAIVIFIHTNWIDTAFIPELYENALNILKELGMNSIFTEAENQPFPSPVYYTFNSLLTNVFIGLILGLAVSPIVINYKSKQHKA
ncbi:MAG: DUF4199 domain-containing protein [Dysgonamonadaceae bacterium]|jgi:hypothetical protein|nr:DUF4199 domain-containing protein [Dysgonamonadaceae bacterium]MDD3309138.1 DUF4199 domain-containing protein [Dysgonamonadaceae bacterium]MDD3900649.1 DUF4199 domain-containing protein [Dysgonamonadaceae bacterium]MDD4397951.1 DUF4199 domain-containing protein [Dysgonamonadaceae bacterium]MEA5080188.1 DUF4199 domain-containing protein [Dysgonamonadaceae bacterium]